MAAAARACVPLMLPPPRMPTFMRVELLLGCERLLLGGHLRRIGCAAENQHTMPEGHRLRRLQRNLRLRQLRIERLPSEVVGGEQAVTARVPDGGEVGVRRMVRSEE